MAGTTIVLKPGQLLFKKGDPPTGLYIVRRGELQVFVEEGGAEFSIASIPGGSVIGEMAVFDSRPRSASVKAVAETEITFISRQDFGKMSGQIPNWFTSVIKTLSIRLRTSNDRLQGIKATFNVGVQRMIMIQRIMTILEMLWYRDGEKAEKEWFLDILAAKQTLTLDFCEDITMVDRVFEMLKTHEYYGQRRNSQNREVFVAPTRGTLSRILHWLRQYNSHRPASPLPGPALNMLLTARHYANTSAYDVLNPSLQNLKDYARPAGIDSTEGWEDYLPSLKKVSDDIKVVKDDKGQWQLKMRKKDMKDLVACHILVKAIYAEP